MARGRKNAPPGTEIGIWFKHRGSQSAVATKRSDATSTGSMLAAPYRSSSAQPQMPLPPPPTYDKKADRNYRQSNRFSEHDNRNSFQGHGTYFGDGKTGRQLGRNLLNPDMRIHQTPKDFLAHESRDFAPIPDYHTTYQNTFPVKQTEQPRHRRFRKSLPAVVAPAGRVQLSTTTTDWGPSSAPEHRTDTQVLAVSQEPFLKHNPWQYSYHSKRTVYPSYDRKREPVIDNTFNRYGAAFNTAGSFMSGPLDSTGGLNSTGFSALQATGCS